jgi:hypothetical protein
MVVVLVAVANTLKTVGLDDTGFFDRITGLTGLEKPPCGELHDHG